MDEENNSTQYDLDDILAEFRSDAAPELLSRETEAVERSRRIVMRSMDDAFRPEGGEIQSAGITSAEDAAENPAVSEPPSAPEEPEAPPEPAVEVRSVEEKEDAQYAGADAADALPEDFVDETAEAEKAERRPKKEKGPSLLMALMALIALRRQRRAGSEVRRPTVEPASEDVPAADPPPEKAVRLYGSQMGSLRLRGLLSGVVCLVMLYLSLAYSSTVLPLTGALGNGVRALSLLLMILELTVVVIGLDVFTGGLLAVTKRRMGAESLIAVSCILSLLDAAVLAIINKPEYGLPFCAVSAVSLCTAIWGAYYTCKGRRTGFRVLAASKTLYTVSAETGLAEDQSALLKSRRDHEGFIRRTEEADLGEYVYGTLTPFLLIAALVLGLLSSLARGRAGAALHCVSILTAVSATFSCAICFSLPFATLAAKLYQSGAAIAGWSGLRDIGRSRYVVVTDGDVFPRGTVSVDKIRILEGSFTDKVVSYTGSVIVASGSGLAGIFSNMIRRNGYTLRKVEDFTPHDGGGLSAVINGDTVLVGGAGFMNLNGIRLPQKLNTKSSLFTAINGSLVGIFNVNYQAVGSVQGALVVLLHSKLDPLFAIRDFNITPEMIKRKFRMPTDAFKFPSYAERYRVSAAEPSEDSRVAAVVAREGMGPLVEAAERGRRAHTGIRVATVISAVGSIFGMLVMFLLCWTGAFDSASVSNVVIFMLLWLLPEGLIVFGLIR